DRFRDEHRRARTSGGEGDSSMRPPPIDPNASSNRLTAPLDARDADARTTTLRANARTRVPALVWAVLVFAILVGGTVAFLVYRRGRGQSATSAAARTASGMAGMKMSNDGTVRLTAQQISQFGVTFGTAQVRTL